MRLGRAVPGSVKGFSRGVQSASGMKDPVVQVVNEATKEIVHTVRFFDPDGAAEKVVRGVSTK